MVAERFDVYLVSLDPTVGSEIKKIRPCLIVSPNELNRPRRDRHRRADDHKGTRVSDARPLCFCGKAGEIVLDQLRTVDRAGLVKRLERIESAARKAVLTGLSEMFAS
jgi:mRNA interferase MazF